MARLRRETREALPDNASLRLRAAWLYYNQGLPQKDIAGRLGVSRVTVARMLDQAVNRREVQFWIDEGESECVELALRLESAFDLDEAIVVPSQGRDGKGEDAEAAAKGVGLALGRFLTDAIPDDCVVGVGWGRTVSASLASFRPAGRTGVSVVSLAGGIIETHLASPQEVAWRLASQLDADCYFFPAPLLVDSPATREALVERCGLDRIHRLADRLDIAVITTGNVGPSSTAISNALLSAAEREELLSLGCVSDLLCHFLDAEGRTVPHPVNERVMAVELEAIARAGHVVLATGGAARVPALRAAIARVGCNTLITDEAAARGLLDG